MSRVRPRLMKSEAAPRIWRTFLHPAEHAGNPLLGTTNAGLGGASAAPWLASRPSPLRIPPVTRQRVFEVHSGSPQLCHTSWLSIDHLYFVPILLAVGHCVPLDQAGPWLVPTWMRHSTRLCAECAKYSAPHLRERLVLYFVIWGSFGLLHCARRGPTYSYLVHPRRRTGAGVPDLRSRGPFPWGVAGSYPVCR